jgi:hypothetical protein
VFITPMAVFFAEINNTLRKTSKLKAEASAAFLGDFKL